MPDSYTVVQLAEDPSQVDDDSVMESRVVATRLRASLHVLIRDADLRLNLDLPDDPTERAAAVRQETETVFSFFGFDGLADLEGSFAALDQDSKNPDLAGQVRADYAAVRISVDKRVLEAAGQVEKKAVAIGRARLAASLQEVRSEAVRYLQGVTSVDQADQVLRNNVLTWLFKRTDAGGEAEALIQALVELQSLREQAVEAETDAKDQWTQLVNRQDPEVLAGQLSPGARAFVLKKRPGLARAEERAQNTTIALVEAVTRLNALYPITHRLLPMVVLPQYPNGYTSWLTAPRGQEDRMIALQDAVVRTLSDTQAQASEIDRQFAHDPQAVWEYPALIGSALDELNAVEGTFLYQAAQETLNKQPLTVTEEWLSTIQMAFGAADMVSWLIGAAEPPAFAMERIIGAVTGLLQSGLEAYTKHRDAAASRACLDPRLGLAEAPDWTWFWINLVCNVVGLRGLKA